MIELSSLLKMQRSEDPWRLELGFQFITELTHRKICCTFSLSYGMKFDCGEQRIGLWAGGAAQVARVAWLGILCAVEYSLRLEMLGVIIL